MTRLKSIFNPEKISAILILIFFAEIFSLFGYFIPVLGPVFFSALVILTLALSIKDLKLGIYILLAELFIGSKGYLFFLDFNGRTVSIRIALFGVVMGVWAIKKMICARASHPEPRGEGSSDKRLSRHEAREVSYQSCPKSASPAKKNKPVLNHQAFKENIDLLIFFALIGMGLLNGIYNKNSAGNIFYDFNGWLYFLIALPIFDTLKKSDLKTIQNIFIASVIGIAAKTLIFLYAFSHFSPWDIYPYYRWIRDTGAGEITLMPNSFYRIFFQSQIFALAGIFIILASVLPEMDSASFKAKTAFSRLKLFMKENYFLLSVVCFLLSATLISFSRSYFAGLAGGMVLTIFLAIFSFGWKMFFKIIPVLAIIGAGSLLIIFLAAKFPFPRAVTDFNALSLADRATELSGEAGASSRWALLPPLWEKIKSAPIFGRGFGATVTYKSSDPRVLETSPDGTYTTYAFEWGWLDIWLKIGLFGLLAYLILIMRVTLQAFRSLKSQRAEYEKHKFINPGIVIGLLSICAVSVFSPYMNHPLGIGYLILALTFMSLSQEDNLVGEENRQSLHIS